MFETTPALHFTPSDEQSQLPIKKRESAGRLCRVYLDDSLSVFSILSRTIHPKNFTVKRAGGQTGQTLGRPSRLAAVSYSALLTGAFKDTSVWAEWTGLVSRSL